MSTASVAVGLPRVGHSGAHRRICAPSLRLPCHPSGARVPACAVPPQPTRHCHARRPVATAFDRRQRGGMEAQRRPPGPPSLLARTQARSPPPTKPLGRGVRPAGRRARPHPRRGECGPVADQQRARARARARPGQAQPPTVPSRQSSAQRALRMLLGSPRTSASTAGCGTALAVAAKGGSCPSASPASSPCAAPPPVSC